jgi:hypothetical protein
VSTHVDGAPPSVAPGDPDDGEPPVPSAGMGSEWVRAEMQRRMAANRSTRGRHARAAEAAAARRRDDDPPITAAGLPRRVRPARPAVPVPPPEPASPADLPENYVPRHSVQTPGPAAEPAAPISGPIPVMRPPAGRAPARPAPAAPESARPAAAGLAPAGPASTGPAPAAPAHDSAPAEAPDTGSTTGRRAHGATANGAGANGAHRAPTDDGPVNRPSPPAGRLPVRRRRGSGPGTPLQAGDEPSGASWTRPGTIVPPDPARRLGAPPEALGATPPWGPPTASPPRGVAAPVRPADGPPTGTPQAPGPEAVTVRAPAAPAPGTRTDGTADAPEAPSAPADAEAPVEVPAETTDEITDEIPGGVMDTPTAPHPVVAGQRATLSGRVVGVPLPRTSDHTRIPARPVAPRPVTPRNIPVIGTAPPEPGSTRVRVVLSERKGVARPVRTIKEVQEGTPVGELLRRDLIRSQMRVTLRFAALTLLVLGVLPAVFAMLPVVGHARVLGVGVPWVVLGILMYPFLVGLAWRYTRVAERVEQNFADHVQD